MTGCECPRLIVAGPPKKSRYSRPCSSQMLRPLAAHGEQIHAPPRAHEVLRLFFAPTYHDGLSPVRISDGVCTQRGGRSDPRATWRRAWPERSEGYAKTLTARCAASIRGIG